MSFDKIFRAFLIADGAAVVVWFMATHNPNWQLALVAIIAELLWITLIVLWPIVRR